MGLECGRVGNRQRLLRGSGRGEPKGPNVSPYFLSFPSCTSTLPAHCQLGAPSLAMGGHHSVGSENRRLGSAHQGSLLRKRRNRHGVELGAPHPPTVPCSSLLYPAGRWAWLGLAFCPGGVSPGPELCAPCSS